MKKKTGAISSKKFDILLFNSMQKGQNYSINNKYEEKMRGKMLKINKNM